MSVDRVGIDAVLRVLADGGHLAETCPSNRECKYTLCSWEGRRPGPARRVSKGLFERLIAIGIIEPAGRREDKDGTVVNYYKLTGRPRAEEAEADLAQAVRDMTAMAATIRVRKLDDTDCCPWCKHNCPPEDYCPGWDGKGCFAWRGRPC